MRPVPQQSVVTVGTILSLLVSAAFAAPAAATEARRVEVDTESPEESDDSPSARPAEGPPSWADDAPAPTDAPQLRNVEPRTRLYLDGTFAHTTDLSALPQIAGSGRNWRGAVGGSLRWRRFQFDVELPAAQATTVDLENVDPFIIREADRHQTSLSIGDLRLGAQWTQALPVEAMALTAGFGMRVRAPTHTTQFRFINVAPDGTELEVVTYALPYYFHLEPTLLFGGALGPVSFVMNQGALILMGPDAQIGDLPIIIPTLYFWDAHYALAWRMIRLLAVSVELNTTMQFGHVPGLDFVKLNDVFAMSVIPGVQWHFGAYRVDTAARLGLTHGSELLGVIGFAGTRSFILRVSRVFD